MKQTQDTTEVFQRLSVSLNQYGPHQIPLDAYEMRVVLAELINNITENMLKDML